MKLPSLFGAKTTNIAETRDASPINANGLFGAAWAALSGGTQLTSSGEVVNELVALQTVSVYACVRVLSESVASLPLKLYTRLPKGRKEAIDDPVYRMLTVSPNPEMSAVTLIETMVGNLSLTGNAYCEILRNPADKVAGLYPLNPLMTHPVRLPDKSLAYKTSVGMPAGQTRIIDAKDCLHVLLYSLDGLVGLSPIKQAAQAVGLVRASEKFGAKFFGNSSRPGGLLTPVGKVDEKDMVNMRSWWEQSNSAENQGRTGVLPSDWKYQQIGISPEESQFLQTRQFGRTDIAALFRVPPNMIGDTSRLSNNNHEQVSLSFVTDTLAPILKRIEVEVARKLLPDNGSQFVEFDVSERLRGDFATTQQGFATGRQWGWYSTNAILEKMGENPIGPLGDVYLTPVNMVNSETLLHQDKTEPVEPIAPTEAQRSLFAAYIPAYTGLMSDAIGRIASRSKRDADSITPILSPILTSIIELAQTEARSTFGLPDTWAASDKIIREHIKGVSRRLADWTTEYEWSADTRQHMTGAELTKAIRSLHIGVYKEAGTALALTRLEQHAEDAA